MKKLLLVITLFTGLISFGQELKINSESAKIGFNFIDENTKGTFKGLEATINFNSDDPSKSVIKGSVDAKTISTGNKTRDKHLMSSDFFEVDKFSKITFTSTSIVKSGNAYTMKGKLKIKGVEKEVTFSFTYERKMFKGTTTIYAQDFGVWKKGKREKSKVEISIEIPVL